MASRNRRLITRSPNGWRPIAAERFAGATNVDVAVLMSTRSLLVGRIAFSDTSACDYLKVGAAYLSAQPSPRHKDSEQTLAEARASIRKTVAYRRVSRLLTNSNSGASRHALPQALHSMLRLVGSAGVELWVVARASLGRRQERSRCQQRRSKNGAMPYA